MTHGDSGNVLLNLPPSPYHSEENNTPPDSEYIKEDTYSVDDEEPNVDDDAHDFDGASDTSVSRTFINFLKSYVGSGILGLPSAFMQGGIILSVIGVLLVAIISNYCIRLLLQCAQDIDANCRVSFQQIGEKCYGKWGRFAVDFSLFISQVGFCCAYVIYVGTTMNKIYDGIPEYGYSLLVLPLFVLLCWIRTYKWLALVSLAGQGLMSLGLLAVVIYSCISLAENNPGVKLANWSGLPLYFGTIVYTYEGIGLVMPMRKAMTNPLKYTTVLDFGYVTVTAMYLTVGCLGYLGYGAGTASEITSNLPKGWVANSVKVMTVLAIVFTYPVQMFPVISMLEQYVFGKVSVEKRMSMSFEWQRNGLRTVLVVITGLVAIAIPFFNLFINLVGAVGCSLMAFILPCLFHMKLFFGRCGLPILLLNLALLGFGLIASEISAAITIASIYSAIVDGTDG